MLCLPANNAADIVSKGKAMKIPVETKPLLWGAAGGAAIVAVAGFGWAGWTTANSAEAMAVKRSDEAVVAALAPVCVDRFGLDNAAAANLVALKAADSWTRSDLVVKGGWARIGTGATDMRHSAVARACAELLVPQ